MKAITTTKNLCLTKEEKEEAWDSNKPVQLALALPRVCNADCIYCYTKDYKQFGDSLSLKDVELLLNEAIELGVETLVLPGYGEPLMNPLFWDIVELAEKLGLYILVFSNATLINEEIAKKLFTKPVSLMIKVNSLDSNCQDKMAGKNGFSKSQQLGLKALIGAGFNKVDKNGQSRLAIDTLISKMTTTDVVDVVAWAINNDIFPFVETLLYMGTAIDNFKELGSPNEIGLINSSVFEKLNEKFPSRSSNQSTFGASCDAETYTLFMELSGHAVRCFSRRNTVGQFPQESLRNIWKNLHKERVEFISGIDSRHGNSAGKSSCDICGHCQGRLEALKMLQL